MILTPEIIVAPQEMNNITESQRSSIISLKSESFTEDSNHQKKDSITEETSIKPIKNGVVSNGSTAESSVRFVRQSEVQQNSMAIIKRSELRKVDVLQKSAETKIEEKENGIDEQAYIKVPVRDLISTFERQTRPIIRYKLRDDILPKANEVQKEKDTHDENNKENNEPKDGHELTVNHENISKTVDTQKLEEYSSYEGNSDLYNYSKSVASMTFSQNESQFSTISYNGIDEANSQQCIIKPTPFRLTEVNATDAEKQVQKCYEYEDNGQKGKRMFLF